MISKRANSFLSWVFPFWSLMELNFVTLVFTQKYWSLYLVVSVCGLVLAHILFPFFQLQENGLARRRLFSGVWKVVKGSEVENYYHANIRGFDMAIFELKDDKVMSIDLYNHGIKEIVSRFIHEHCTSAQAGPSEKLLKRNRQSLYRAILWLILGAVIVFLVNSATK